MAGADASKKFFEAWNESTDALIDAVRAANDRGHRVSTALIEEAQETQRAAAELAKKWAATPFDFFGLYGAMMETATKAQGRALDVSRQWFGELADIQKESRDYLQRVTAANRTAGEGGVELARNFFTRASDAIQNASQSMAAAAAGNGRRTREPVRAGDSPSDLIGGTTP
jgi:hypothetical protein